MPMSLRVPTERQHRILLLLGAGSAWLSATKRECEPLLRHGWVTAEWDPPCYQWVRITPDGLRALATSVEKYGLPNMKAEARKQVCSDCGADWKPRCRCGGRAYRYALVEAAA